MDMDIMDILERNLTCKTDIKRDRVHPAATGKIDLPDAGDRVSGRILHEKRRVGRYKDQKPYLIRAIAEFHSRIKPECFARRLSPPRQIRTNCIIELNQFVRT